MHTVVYLEYGRYRYTFAVNYLADSPQVFVIVSRKASGLVVTQKWLPVKRARKIFDALRSAGCKPFAKPLISE